MDEIKQSYIVEYEVGQDIKFIHIIAVNEADARSQFYSSKIEGAQFPVFEAAGKVLTDEEYNNKIKK